MASSLILFRRCMRPLSDLHHSFSATFTSLSVPITHSISSSPSRVESPNFTVQSRSFRSTSISLLSSRYEDRNITVDNIGSDTILFEGCDYNHWLFVMDFGRDNKPPPEEMIRVYEETCAKGLNISLEEAKKKIYACSTTTYTGFQAVMTEEESKKFENLPEVIFVLPDSYIDPVNKQYGGDQYIDGTIIPRPPPVHYGRNQQQGGRRYLNQQNNPMPNNQGSPSCNNRGPVPREGRNYGPSQNYPPQQNSGYGPPPQSPPQQSSNMRFDSASLHYPPKQSHNQAPQGYPPKPNYGQPSQNYSPPQNINQAPHSYPQQQTYGPASPQQSFGPPGQGERTNYAPPQNFGPPGQGERRNYVPQQNFGPPGQGERNYVPQQNFGPSRQGERRDPVPSEGGWDFKPSYMEEFEQVEKEKSTGEGRY
ncbi:multiple organellar RNA editing factor 1, mitochondrial-like [Trifolium pratense]|uniref:multiple organellar RNA editing factor 1, mitochondrial-like n=1 Tax=Trifolium pratense TaxID=57577 RepID=UPI001E694D0B|nr:multiple organellar RNA editing factor 1, mitochondrial-like [Trifolium pratense]